MSRWVQLAMDAPPRLRTVRLRAGRRDRSCRGRRPAASAASPDRPTRNDSGSASMMPTSTSPTIRPPTGPEPVAVAERRRPPEDVEPERRLVAPAVLARPTCRRRERLDAESRARPPRPTAARSPGRAAGRARPASGRPSSSTSPGDLRRQRDQARGQPPVDALGALRRRRARRRRRAASSRRRARAGRRRSPSGRGTSAAGPQSRVDAVAVRGSGCGRSGTRRRRTRTGCTARRPSA